MMKDSKQLSCCIIGGTSVLIRCAEILLKHQYVINQIVSKDPIVKDWANSKEINCTQSMKVLEAQVCDYLFSIANEQILPPKIFQSVRRLAINYHDGPLPKYAGTHATAWAILNNENTHGITWHIIEEKVDGGDILKQSTIVIDPNETTFSLNVKCYNSAVETFEELVAEAKGNKLFRIKQCSFQRTFFESNKKPFGNGLISWRWSLPVISRMFRALNFGPYANRFCVTKVFFGKNVYAVKKMNFYKKASTDKSGTIERITREKINVSTKSGIVSFVELAGLNGKTQDLLNVVEENNLREGLLLYDADDNFLKDYDKKIKKISKNERYWVNSLKSAPKSNFSFLGVRNNLKREQQGENKSVAVHFNQEAFRKIKENDPNLICSDEQIMLTVLLVYLYRINNYKEVLVHLTTEKIKDFVFGFEALLSNVVPLFIEMNPHESFHSFYQNAQKKIGLIDENITFPYDILLRYPSLKNIQHESPILINLTDRVENYVKNNYLVTINIIKNDAKYHFFVNEKISCNDYLQFYFNKIQLN